MTQLFVNNLVAKLASSIDNISNTITVENTTGFPVMVQGDWFYLTLSDKREGGELRWEVVKVTSYSANTLTVIRAQSNTTAQSWSVGSELSLRVTAADMFELEAFKDSKGQVNGLAPLDSSSQVPVLNIPNLDAGKLTSGIIDPARYVASDLLTKIKTVDGASSGLDADLLDGQQGSYYQQNLKNVAVIELSQSLTGDRWSTLDFHSSDGVDYSARINRLSGIDGQMDIVQTGNGTINVSGGSEFTRGGNTIWHAGNDGAGSGLDADLLDGLNSTQFLRKDISGTLTGTLSVTGQVLASQSTNATGGYSFSNDGDTGMFSPSDGVLDLYSNFHKRVSITSNVNILAPLQVTGNTVWHDGLAAKSLGTNGYQKLPSGLIIQWVSLAAGATSGTWPIAFPNECLSALPGAVIESTNNYAFVQVASKTTTGFTAQVYGAATGSAPGATSYAYLVVGIGY